MWMLLLVLLLLMLCSPPQAFNVLARGSADLHDALCVAAVPSVGLTGLKLDGRALSIIRDRLLAV